MSFFLDILANPMQAIVAALTAAVALLGWRNASNKAKAKKAEKKAERAEKEVRRRVAVQEEDGRILNELEEKRSEVKDASRDELIDRLTNR